MYVCLCAQVTEEQWEKALDTADRDWLAASAATGAGLGCGGCRVYLRASSTFQPLPQVDPCPEPSPLVCPAASLVTG